MIPAVFQNVVSDLCPVCGNRDIEKVSGVIARGASGTHSSATTLAYSRGAGMGFATVAQTTGSATTTTELFRRLAPPIHPMKKQDLSWLAILFAAFVAPCLYGVFNVGATPMMLFLLFFMIGGGVTCLIAGAGARAFNRTEHIQQVGRWNQAMQSWDRLYYCGKCDSVHDPVERRSAPSHSMFQLI